jgi:hypothetical protein
MSEGVTYTGNGAIVYEAFCEWYSSRFHIWKPDQLGKYNRLRGLINELSCGEHVDISLRILKHLESTKPASFSDEFKAKLDRMLGESGEDDPAIALLKEIDASVDERMQYVLHMRASYRFPAA